MNEIVKILLFSALSYVTLFIISKLLGKKQLAELDFIDYVTGISIGSIAAEMATETDTPFYYYIIAMAIFFVLDLAVTLVGRKANFFKKFLRGVPLVLISQGEIDFATLKKSKIDFYDLIGLAREQGYFDLEDIEYAIFETNGQLSVLPSDKARPLKREDFSSIPAETPSVPNYVVVDGQISGYALSQLKRDKKWLKAKLQEQDVEINKVLYAVYDEQTDELTVKYKKAASN